MFIKSSDGVDLYVKISDKGYPCIFLHGGPGSCSGSFEELGGNIYVLSHEEYLKDYTPITEAIHIPVLVVSGENYISIGPMHHKAFRFKKQKPFIASGGSHFWYHENNADFYNCIKEFITNYPF